MTIVCLQGGNELTPPSRPMDRALLDIAPDGDLVVLPLASKPGADYDRIGENARDYFRGLGAAAVVPPDPRKNRDPAAAAVDGAGFVVLTGGSPRVLRDALIATGIGDRVKAAADRGALVMGSSAGAMVACATTLLPQWRGIPDAGPGLGLIEGYVVVPHFDGKRPQWVRVALSVAQQVLGIPENSGVVVRDGELTAIGAAPSTLITADGRTELPLSV